MINIKAQEQYSALLKKDVFIMQPQGIYSKMDEDDTMTELRHETGLPNGVIRNALSGIRAVIKAFVCNGHSVYLPGLGTFRYSVKGKAVDSVEEVSHTLIESRKLIFIPDVKIKQDLADTSISITCYDKNGKVIKKTTSTSGVVDDGDDTNNDPNNDPGNGGGTQQPAATKYTLTLKKADNDVISTTELEAGAAITYPTATSGYMWPADAPTVMPAQATTVTEVVDDDPNVL